MKSITTYITEKMVYNKSTANKIKYNYYPETKEELKLYMSQFFNLQEDINDCFNLANQLA